MSEPPLSGRVPRPAALRMGFERRIAMVSWALAALAFVFGGWCILRLQLEWPWHCAALLALLMVTGGLWTALRNLVSAPLRGLTNVVEAYRGGDYTMRSARELPNDALGDLVHEINSLGDTLHRQRLRAMEATALFDKLIAAISVAVLAFDGEGRLRLYNPAASELLRFRAEEAFGQTATSLELDRFLTDETPTRVETSIAGRNGRWQIMHGTFREGGLAQHLVLISDVQQALREEERVAWQRLIRVIGHEVNNSLTPMQSLAETLHELLKTSLPAGNLRQETLGGLKVIADRTRGLARFLGQYSRLARLPPPRPRWLPLEPLMKRVAALQFPSRLEVAVMANIEAHVDEDQLEQALINLSRNAIEAQGEAGGSVVIRASLQNMDLSITVTDEGPGIANLDNLFVPFFTTKPGGSGVGLLLSRQIAEAHGGSLTLANRSDVRGAVAIIELPGVGRIADAIAVIGA